MTLDTSEVKCPRCGHVYNDTSLQEESTFTFPEKGILSHEWYSTCPKCGAHLGVELEYDVRRIDVFTDDGDGGELYTRRFRGDEGWL